MSRVKSPQEKKTLSLDRDRRNVFGENDKASRKNISRARQRGHMKLRRNVRQALRKARAEFDNQAADDAESILRDRSERSGKRPFEKTPDLPLGIVIDRQRRRQVEKAISAALRQSSIREDGPVCVGVGEFEAHVYKRDAERATKVLAATLKLMEMRLPQSPDAERKFWRSRL
jgi:hypothetical protein